MTTTLFEISHDLLELEKALDDLSDLPEEQAKALADWLDNLAKEKLEERDLKIDNYAALIRELESRAEARKVEAKRLSGLARIDENRAKSLKLSLQIFFETHELSKVETARYRFSLVNNGGKLPVQIDEIPISEIPERFVRVVQFPDMDAIRSELEAGSALDFARLGVRGKSLRIK